MAVLDVQFLKLPGWSCAASYFFITSHTAEYPIIRAAGVLSRLMRNTGVKEVWRYQGRRCSSAQPHPGGQRSRVRGPWRWEFCSFPQTTLKVYNAPGPISTFRESFLSLRSHAGPDSLRCLHPYAQYFRSLEKKTYVGSETLPTSIKERGISTS
eukprot:1145969-Pelagomonas_calceolata.AAC.2